MVLGSGSLFDPHAVEEVIFSEAKRRMLVFGVEDLRSDLILNRAVIALYGDDFGIGCACNLVGTGVPLR